VKKQLYIRYSKNTVECFHSGKRVASHARRDQQGRHTTVKGHMPLKHQKYMEWTPERFKRLAGTIARKHSFLPKPCWCREPIRNRPIEACWES